MKKKMLLIELITGMIILLGGLMTYGLGIHNILPVPRPDLVVWGTTLVGIIFILSGSDLLSKKTKAVNILRWRSHPISWNRAMESVIESHSSNGGSHDPCRGSQ